MAHSSAREYPWSRLDSDNLTGLEEMTEKALLSATKQRYGSNLIYTDVGDILVAVNPFRELPIYDEAWSTAYSCPDVSTLAPHIYRVAARAFNAMVQGKKDQVCVISGESGAGKTESAKFIMYQVRNNMFNETITHNKYYILYYELGLSVITEHLMLYEIG